MPTLFKYLLAMPLILFFSGCAMLPTHQTLGMDMNSVASPAGINEQAPTQSIGALVNKYPSCNSWCHNHWCSVHCGPDPY